MNCTHTVTDVTEIVKLCVEMEYSVAKKEASTHFQSEEITQLKTRFS